MMRGPLTQQSQTRRIRWTTGVTGPLARDLAFLVFGEGRNAG